MHAKHDRHGKRTEIMLHDALIALISEKGFDAITVGDLADRAMIHRATFYRHYCDKYALVTAIYEKAIKDLVSDLGPLEQRLRIVPFVANKDDAFAEQAITPEVDRVLNTYTALFEHIAENARLYKSLLGKRGSSWFSAQLRDDFARNLHSRLQESKGLVSEELDISDPVYDRVLTVGLASWLIGIISGWLEDGMKIPPRQISLFSLRFVTYGMYPYITSLNKALANDLRAARLQSPP